MVPLLLAPVLLFVLPRKLKHTCNGNHDKKASGLVLPIKLNLPGWVWLGKARGGGGWRIYIYIYNIRERREKGEERRDKGEREKWARPDILDGHGLQQPGSAKISSEAEQNSKA